MQADATAGKRARASTLGACAFWLVSAFWVDRAAVPCALADAPKLEVGAKFADFGLPAWSPSSFELTRKPLWLSNYVGPQAEPHVRKRVLLLTFFATWCAPCLQELPLLSELQHRYGADGFQVLAINVRQANQSAAQALQEARAALPALGLDFPLLFDRYTRRTQTLYLGSSSTLPHNILVDAQGILRARYVGAEPVRSGELEDEVRRLLGLQPQSLSRAPEGAP